MSSPPEGDSHLPEAGRNPEQGDVTQGTLPCGLQHLWQQRSAAPNACRHRNPPSSEATALGGGSWDGATLRYAAQHSWELGRGTSPKRSCCLFLQLHRCGYRSSRAGCLPSRGAPGQSISRQSASQQGLLVPSPGSGRGDALLENLPPACRVSAAGTGNAQGGTRSGSHTLTLPNFDTTHGGGQRLRACQGEAGGPALMLVFSLSISSVVLLLNLAGLRSALRIPCPTQEL